MGGGASRVHDAFRDALVVEAHDLLAQMKIFEQRGTARPRMQRIVGLLDLHALIGSERRVLWILAEQLQASVLVWRIV
jgi:hypothetical protein